VENSNKKMKIITIPHQSLRQKARVVKRVDKKLVKFVSDLKKTLKGSNKPKGVGLAAPQVDKLIRAFAVRAGDDDKIDTWPVEVLINPIVARHCKRNMVLGPKPNQNRFEGCLSMPNMWGPVPRWRWLEVEYQILEDGTLINKKKRFDDFAARVVQHELDHLEGILFTDHSLQFDLLFI